MLDASMILEQDLVKHILDFEGEKNTRRGVELY
jgi:hypothetical protein